MTWDHPIPVTIITGFLGAGKTTLLNFILQAHKVERTAVLLNDFGSINIDAELVGQVEGGIFSLANGCICCSIRRDLRASILELANVAEPPKHILIETSGVANPVAVVHALDIPELQGKVRIDSIITVVDAEQIQHLTGEIAQLSKAQILSANTLLLNKVDLVTDGQLSAVHDWLVALNPGASVFNATSGRAPIEALLPTRAQVRQQESPSLKIAVETQICKESTKADQEVPPNHELLFDVWTYTSKIPLRVTAFQAFINQLPDEVYRVKGYLHLAERPKTRTILQKVANHISLSGGKAWSGTPQSWLVFIASKGSLDEAALQAKMDACQVPWWSRWIRNKR